MGLKSHWEVLIGSIRTSPSKLSWRQKQYSHTADILVAISPLCYILYFSLVFLYLVLLAALHPIRKLLCLNSTLYSFILIAWITDIKYYYFPRIGEKLLNLGIFLLFTHQLLNNEVFSSLLFDLRSTEQKTSKCTL